MLGNIEPREQAGRDVLARFRAQVRSAALASLSILEGKDVDRVYCDLHDDFVVRTNRDGNFYYAFYQVKTNKKKNHNWTLKEIFGLSSRVKDFSKHKNTDIHNSFAGKLLQHTVSFGENCEAVVFQTNINVEDAIDHLIKDIKDGNFDNKIAALLSERFPVCFSCSKIGQQEVEEKLKKLEFSTDVPHLKLEYDGFNPAAREAIYKYSEIDLAHDEVRDITIKLVELVESRSSGVISDLSQDSIDKWASVSISDLLEILSISKGAYAALMDGGDALAVKNASIIQRTLNDAGASEDQIEFCSRSKISWDNWFRTNRHILPELEVMTVQSDVSEILRSALSGGQLNLSSLKLPIENYLDHIKNKNYDLDSSTILGGIMAELVRIKR